MEECSRRLNALSVAEIVCVRGNHEDANWVDFAPGRIRSLNGRACAIGPLVVVGLLCLLGDASWFLGPEAAASPDVSDWFPKIVQKYGAAARTLWLAHEPPNLTRLSVRSGPLQGNAEWRAAIEQYSPLAVVSGHDHETPWQTGHWHDRIDHTVCLNAGQKRDFLQYLLIDATFASAAIALPIALTVRHYPTKEILEMA